MNQLFNCRNIRWNGIEYEELPEEELVAIFDDEVVDEADDELSENGVYSDEINDDEIHDEDN